MIKGRLGLQSPRIPHRDRHGLVWLGRGRLTAHEGCLNFATAGDGALPAGHYQLPFQGTSFILMAPGCTVSHDALRLLARHGTGLVAIGEDTVRCYTSMPHGPDQSDRARRQAQLWATLSTRRTIAHKMYAKRLNRDVSYAQDIDVLRGIEGQHARKMYSRLATQYGIKWVKRSYDRDDPNGADLPNQALNHAATAVYAAATVAVHVCGAIPQLGFIHEDSGRSFCLDIADLYRDTDTIIIAFSACAEAIHQDREDDIERITRKTAGEHMTRRKLVAEMIDLIKELLHVGADRSHP